MIGSLLAQFFGTQHEREIKALRPMVESVDRLEKIFSAMSDSELRSQTAIMKEEVGKGRALDDLQAQAFAVCREASKRVLGMRHYGVQIVGGWTLYQGRIAEMKTGEGKTLVATLPVYLEALKGKGVHVVTVNDYLAQRDTEWMGQLYHFLGITTGTITHDLSDQERKKAYQQDIIYGTNNELGFDYLRDNMKFNLEDCVQRELNYAIVDECDSILIDEARTPLIISGSKDESTNKYYEVNRIVSHLKPEVHFTMEEKSKTVSLTEEGSAKVESLLNITNLYDISSISFLHHIYQALKAYYLYRKDVDYMVKNNEIVIVDEFTGRLMPGRRWSEGLHQAIEAKEGVKVRKENQTLATITFQNYFRQYKKLAGMTGTAETEAVEFKKIYDLDVMVIPTNKPIQRKDFNDVIYKTEKVKMDNIIEDIKQCQKIGQPILVGTISIEKSEEISQILKEYNIKHNVLNARHHEREAEIVAQAGRKGAVTIATNMAGRGTDIVLGGNSEFLAQSEAKSKEKDILNKYKSLCEEEKKEVLEAGGLYIVGTERHEARRIDNQLRGRSGRQGDPGQSRFYLSLEDNLMRIFGGERMQKIMSTLKIPEDEAITDRMVSRAIAGAQRKVEGHNFSIRKHLLDYDDVMNQQRTAIYTLRRDILRAKNLERIVLDYLGDVTSLLLDTFVNENTKPELWNFEALTAALLKNFGILLAFEDQEKRQVDIINQKVQKEVKQSYDKKKEELGEHFSSVVQFILLQTIDSLWKEHLENIDYVKEGINLRGYAQKDPLIEYKKEAFSLFEQVNQQIAQECIEKLFKIQLSGSANYDMSHRYNEEKLDYNSDNEAMDWKNMSSQKGSDLSYNREETPQMNRAQRRMQQRKKKKIKI